MGNSVTSIGYMVSNSLCIVRSLVNLICGLVRMAKRSRDSLIYIVSNANNVGADIGKLLNFHSRIRKL